MQHFRMSHLLPDKYRFRMPCRGICQEYLKPLPHIRFLLLFPRYVCHVNYHIHLSNNLMQADVLFRYIRGLQAMYSVRCLKISDPKSLDAIICHLWVVEIRICKVETDIHNAHYYTFSCIDLWQIPTFIYG